MQIQLDKWQEQVLQTKGNIALCSGRQVGKSTIISQKAGEYAANNSNKTILIISAVERQALLLFEKVLAYLHDNYKPFIKKGKDKPTKHTLRLKNGSVIHCLPTGLSGYGIRGYTIDQLYADEAAFIPEEVWTAVSPMLATTGGDIILLSTPHGREGYFARAFTDDSFTTFHVSSEECSRIPKDFLAKEKERMTKMQYSQEYLGHFIDDLQQWFSDEVIAACMTAERPKTRRRYGEFYMGVDIARMGEDESTFEIIDRNGDNLVHVENQITRKTLTTMTTRKIINLNNIYNFKRIYIDDAGLGVGVLDQLIEERTTRRKVVGINNEKRSIDYDRDKPRKKRLLKEDLYNNLLRLMEQGKIQLLDDPEIYQSLKSVQYEYTQDSWGHPVLKIFGNYTHIVEGLIRAAWCVKDKSLNISISWI